jgi:pyrophosphatase PpaX
MNNKTFQNINTLLFDLDGTLLDSFSVHLEIFKTTFAQFGIHLSEEEFLKTYSPNWYETYEAFGLRKEDWEAADSFWLKEAEKINARLFPGVKEIFLKLDKYFTLGLVTSGSKSRVERDIKATGIINFFKTVVTGDDVKVPKPSPEGLEIAFRNLDKQPNEVIYIGDSSADYEMAKAAGVYFIGVSSEFNNLSNNHPDYSVHSIIEIPKLLGMKE